MTRSASRDPDWVGLSEASRVLGVSPATLRRWSDAGRLRVFTTPGGHRRFSRSALERLLPADRSRRPSIGGAGLSPSRIARTYRRASRVLGISPATLRRWSDAGRLRVFTTPGGHRRFSRSALERLLPADRSRRPSIGGAGLSPSRIARTYRRASRDAAPELPWVLTLSDEQRLLFRERGHVLAASLLQYLDAPQPEAAAHHLEEASGSAKGRRHRSRGAAIGQPGGDARGPIGRTAGGRQAS